jgi:hypothetical protein
MARKAPWYGRDYCRAFMKQSPAWVQLADRRKYLAGRPGRNADEERELANLRKLMDAVVKAATARLAPTPNPTGA